MNNYSGFSKYSTCGCKEETSCNCNDILETQKFEEVSIINNDDGTTTETKITHKTINELMELNEKFAEITKTNEAGDKSISVVGDFGEVVVDNTDIVETINNQTEQLLQASTTNTQAVVDKLENINFDTTNITDNATQNKDEIVEAINSKDLPKKFAIKTTHVPLPPFKDGVLNYYVEHILNDKTVDVVVKIGYLDPNSEDNDTKGTLGFENGIMYDFQIYGMSSTERSIQLYKSKDYVPETKLVFNISEWGMAGAPIDFHIQEIYEVVQ